MYKEIDDLFLLAKRDVKAKETLLVKLKPLIIGSIRRYYNKKREYEDLIQEGYEVILKSIEDYDSKKGVHILGYIKVNLKYHYLNKHRQKTFLSLNEPMEDGEVMDFLTSEEKSPLDEILEKEERTHLFKSLNKLTPRQRKVITQFYLKKQSIDEIAKNMGISYRTVVNLKANGLKKLRKEIVK